MAVKKVEFEGHNGNTLKGILHLSNKPGSVFAIFAHCFTCSKDLKSVTAISKELSKNGISVLRFDFTGLGESEGEFSDTNFTTNTRDLIMAAAFLEKNYSQVDILIGHSLGGAAVLQAAGELDSASAVVTIAAPSDPNHVLGLLKNGKQEIESKGEGDIDIAGRTFRIKKQFIDDLKNYTMEQKINELRKALLVMHSPMDNIVGIDNATGIFVPAKHPKSFVSLDNSDHLLSNIKDALYVGSTISSWVSRYLKKGTDSDKKSIKSIDEGSVVVVNEKHSYTSYLYSGEHELVADEPSKHGGDDLGPDPYSYLLASLGSCTAMTIRMYSDKKGWTLEEVKVTLSHEKIHASDCDDCESTEGKIDVIERKIQLSGDLSDEQRNRLGEIADKCPVHRTLTSETVIRTTLA